MGGTEGDPLVQGRCNLGERGQEAVVDLVHLEVPCGWLEGGQRR